MKRLLAVASLALASVACASPVQYSAESFTGRVIDLKTKQPLPGVSVVAQWELSGGLEGATFDLLHVEEAVTNQNGTYTISGWGPIAKPVTGYLDTADPRIVFFKSGYVVKTVSNLGPFAPGDRRDLTVRNSFWNGKVVSLEPAQRTDEIPRGIGATTHLYGTRPRAGRCWWKSAPRFVRAVDVEMKRLREAGVGGVESYAASGLLSRQSCAPFDEFLQRYEETK